MVEQAIDEGQTEVVQEEVALVGGFMIANSKSQSIGHTGAKRKADSCHRTNTVFGIKNTGSP
jgi:hypothetical protein